MGNTFHVDVAFHCDPILPEEVKPRTLEELLKHKDTAWIEKYWVEVPACRDEHGRITVDEQVVSKNGADPTLRFGLKSWLKLQEVIG